MSDDMVTTTCPNETCGVPFSVPRHVFAQAQALGEKRTVFCPNGHKVVWRETDADRLRREVEWLKGEALDRINRFDHLTLSLRYWKGMATRWRRKAEQRG